MCTAILQILPDIIQGCKMSSTGGKKKKKVTKANSLGKVGKLEKLLIGVLTVSTEFVYFPYWYTVASCSVECPVNRVLSTVLVYN